jgi:hypothetical protein
LELKAMDKLRWPDLFYIVLGLTVAVIIILSIKKIIIPLDGINATKDGFFAIEKVAILLLFGAYILKEILNFFNDLFVHQSKQNKAQKYKELHLSIWEVIAILAAFGGSAGIYIGIIKVLDLP